LEAICLAKEINATAVLMDDRAGRNAARRYGLFVTGTIGVLESAAARGLVEFAAAIANLQQTNARLDPELVQAALLNATGPAWNTSVRGQRIGPSNRSVELLFRLSRFRSSASCIQSGTGDGGSAVVGAACEVVNGALPAPVPNGKPRCRVLWHTKDVERRIRCRLKI
jgi:hypothetical protein